MRASAQSPPHGVPGPPTPIAAAGSPAGNAEGGGGDWRRQATERKREAVKRCKWRDLEGVHVQAITGASSPMIDKFYKQKLSNSK